MLYLRLLDRTGLQRMRTSIKWFEDHRCAPQHNARYLKKLETLRTDLIHNDTSSYSQTLTRLTGGDSTGKQTDATPVRPKPKLVASSSDSYPERFKRIQRQRQELLERRRKVDRSVKIDPLKGEKLIDSKRTDEKQTDQSEGTTIDIYDVIASQQARLNQATAEQNGVTYIKPQHQSSIPNLGRKSLVHQKPLLSLDKYNHKRSESFIRQMSLHQKDEKGLYKCSTHRHLLRGDKDEIDLTPDSFRFDLPLERSISYSSSMDSGKQYSVPVSSPIQWHNSTDKLPSVNQTNSEHSETSIIGSNGSTRETNAASVRSSGKTPDSIRQEGMRTNPVECHHPKGPVHPALLRTTTSIYAPTRTGYIRILETENQKANRGQQSKGMRQTKGSRLPKWSSSGSTPLEGLRVNGSTKSQRTGSMPDTVREYPSTVPVRDEHGDVILVNQSDTALDFTFNTTPEMTCVNTPEHTPGLDTPVDQLSTMSENKMNLVVQMPDIILNPPTPTPTRLVHSADDVVSLRKTFRQNELREREVANLLEDVKELTEISEQLKRSKTNITF